jgi:hypothetical protein
MQAAIIRIKVEQDSTVRVIIYDRAMRPVSTLIDQDEAPGYYAVYWYGRNDSNAVVANDVYFVYMQIGSRVVKGYIVVKR